MVFECVVMKLLQITGSCLTDKSNFSNLSSNKLYVFNLCIMNLSIPSQVIE